MSPTHLPDFALYTDAASFANRIDALLFQGTTKHPVVVDLAVSNAPLIWLNSFNLRNTIFGLAMLSPLAFIWETRHKLGRRPINL